MTGRRALLLILAGIFVTSSCGALGNTTGQPEDDLEALKGKAAQVDLVLEDLPVQFVAYNPEDGRMLGERDLFDVQNEFSYISTSENPQTILGMTTVYPYSQRADSIETDRIRSQMELIARSITKGYTIGKNVDVEELLLLNPIGDAYSGRTFNESLANIGYPEYNMRTQVLVFERNRISVVMLVRYVEELPKPVSIEEIARLLDQRIVDLAVPELNADN